MNVLEQARKTYARLKAERNGHVAPVPRNQAKNELNELNEQSPATEKRCSSAEQGDERNELNEQRVKAEGLSSSHSFISYYLYV